MKLSLDLRGKDINGTKISNCSSASLSRTWYSVQDVTRHHLVGVKSLVPWLDDASGHAFDSLIQAPDTFDVDFRVERVAGY